MNYYSKEELDHGFDNGDIDEYDHGFMQGYLNAYKKVKK